MNVKYLILLVLGGAIVLFDQLTKNLVIQYLYYGESVPVIPGFFDISHVRNPGAAFGILARVDSSIRIPLFIVIPIVALLVIAVIFKRLQGRAILLSTAFSLVIGGAIGNLIDRVVYSYVIDFLYFHWKSAASFPAFNIADSAICVGVGLLIFDILKKEQQQKRKA